MALVSSPANAPRADPEAVPIARRVTVPTPRPSNDLVNLDFVLSMLSVFYV